MVVYNKHFIPLESNPDVFNHLIHQLGVSSVLRFHDVWSLSEPEILALIPRPVLALVIVFSTPPQYEDLLDEENQLTPEYTKMGEDEDAMWFKQTINNACGLYGILHAVANGGARDFVGTFPQQIIVKAPKSANVVLTNIVEDDRAEIPSLRLA